MKTRFFLSLALASLAVISSALAEVYTLPDVVRASGQAQIDSHFDFVPNDGWTGTPPNAISGESSLYLKFTVTWSSVVNAQFGSFLVRFNGADDGGAGRWGVHTDGTGFAFETANSASDLDGPNGPGTGKPSVDPVDKSAVTSATFVLKVDQIKAGISPADYPGQNSLKDRWYGDTNTPGAQDEAAGFLYINPNLNSAESGQSTKWAAWRSGNTSYQGITIRTDTDATPLSFTNITLYTGDDSPFSATAAVTDASISTVSASPTAIPADGTTASTVNVTVRDSSGNPIPGKQVSLSGNGTAVIATGNNISNANGVVTFSVKSSAVGTEVFTATAVTESVAITQTASVDFQEVVPIGPVDAGNSSVVASSASVPANGIAISTITVTLRDGNGTLIVGENVTLAGSPANASIGPSDTLLTDSNGRAAFAVSSSAVGTVTFSATSATDSTTVAQTADVDFLDPGTATAYNLNFVDDGQADETGLVGVVGGSGETWNQGTSSASNLVDSTGQTTSSVSVTGLSASGRPISGSTLSVFKANRDVFGKGSDITISITGLTPSTAYDLYIYSLSHSTDSWGDISNTERASGDFVTSNNVLGNGQAQWLDNAVAGTNGNRFVPNGNYVAFQSVVSDGSGNISVVADAYDGIDGDPATNDGNTRLHICGLQIRPASGMSVDYMTWRQTYYPGLGLPGEDDDQDGFTNDFERLFGLDPNNPSSVSPYPATLDAETGSFSYTRRAQALATTKFKVWYSTDLENWSEDNAANQLVASTSNDVQTVGVDIDPNLLGEEKLFIQVRATPITGVDPEPALFNLWGSWNAITLLFSEPMNPSSVGNVNNYSVTEAGSGGINVTGATVSSDGGSVVLTLGSNLGLATGYTVNINGVTSGTGQSLGSNVSRQFTTWDDDPNGIKVFILAGQSNMVGFGETERGNGDVNGAIGSLRHRVLNDASFPDFDYSSLLVDPNNTASAFRTRSDVKVWYRDGGNGQLGGAIKKGDLGPPFMGRDTGKIGPEFAFGQVIGDHYASDDVLIVKCAWGGRDLAQKFRPPTAVADRGGQVGEFYNAIIEYSRQVLNNLDTEFPTWNNRGYQVVGFGWHQGYNDRINSEFSAEYKDNLPDLIEDVRTLFNKPNLPFVIASTGMATGAAEAPPYSGYSEVEKAQLWVAGVPKPANVLSTDTRPFARDVASSPTDQGFHWNQNGETYFMIGKAMGENMVSLLGGP